MITNTLESLNEQQRKAVLHKDGSLLILAGAGSGKTRVITVKIAWFIDELGIDPHSILAVTFTNKAAGEMRARAGSLSPAAGKVMIRTFHSFGAWLLRRNQGLLDIADNFTIYDDDDSLSLLTSLYPDHSKQQLQHWKYLISRAKDNCLGPDGELDLISNDPEFREVYQTYEERLHSIGNVDFGDLVFRTVELLEKNSAVLNRLQKRFSIILVDEYQDSNIAQYSLLKELYNPTGYICVVGDDDQSIYRFRGAQLRNILQFPQQFGNVEIIKLEQNYRSTNPILKLAGRVVGNNEGRLGKELWTSRQGGKKPVLIRLSDQDAELDYVLSLIRDDFPGETAILYRINAQSRAFETRFLRENIPYRIIGTLRFYEREEVKDAIAMLKLLANPRDEISFTRIVNKPTRGIGKITVEKVLTFDHSRQSLLDVADQVLSELTGKAKLGLQEFVAFVRKFTDKLNTRETEQTLGQFLEELLDKSGLAQYYHTQDSISSTTKIQNLEELINAASLYRSSMEELVRFLEVVELDGAREQKDVDARTTLITMHNTKGLEFDRVIITGLEEGYFPRGGDKEDVEEERRLFYVAITRAKDELHITHCISRRIYGRIQRLNPSPFLQEIGEDLIERHGLSKNAFSGEDPWINWKPFAHPTGITSDRKQNINTEETRGEYVPGQRIYHDEYGLGEVIKSSHNGRDEIIHVRFETGHVAQFMPRYSAIEKVSQDY